MGCSCGQRRSNRYIVVGADNNCLLMTGSDCTTFRNVTAANRAAVQAGLSDYWVQMT